MARKKPAPKRGASRYQAPQKKPVPGWVWLLCGLLIGGFVVFLMNLEPAGDEVKRPREDARKSEAPKPSATRPDQQAKPKYDFYTLLPESEVILPPEAEKPAAQPPKPVTPEQAARIDEARAQAALNGEVPPPAPAVVAKAPTTQLFLQAGSFRKQGDADQVRAEILLHGHNVRVESGTVKGETWYRVLVGPFASREQMSKAQQSLAGNGYSNLLPQQRQAN
ncbi:SPOR domain-containing protein [Stutzerimonas kirkiae]|uniref:Cell division protein n=1 Tax=Stutzerimonas kirkiae TaxID=2211392 RepID=A0A4Q9R3N2_9GAMM|nr:SPOR domain-containing protein [Stutzerimonas kirkiae]TBU94058.1 cell division protein [Stutzerimonas kirkiae]TBV06126.1 cell division protein [Stutzerimonas kirkiae]TBV06568.1 cell division protein [Stutzerimonas kirkiae]TBV13709.1 cell division protein [Stutzerimonas kirkiae]